MIGGTHLYLIQSRVSGAFKIGRSANPKRRLRDLQTGSPYELRIILVVENRGDRERLIHQRLQDYRSQGSQKGEWFKEPGLAELPVDLYELLDLEKSTWWETAAGPIDIPGPR